MFAKDELDEEAVLEAAHLPILTDEQAQKVQARALSMYRQGRQDQVSSRQWAVSSGQCGQRAASSEQ
jgi:hypothetical protein